MAIIKPVDESTIFVQELHGFASAKQSVYMLRLDKMHPIISGNKWYKLKYNLEDALQQKAKGILTFGGAYSNHLIATAAAANANGISSVAIVRGERNNTKALNTVLTQCKDYGMDLHFVSREEYALKETDSFIEALNNQYPEYYFIPEGGANEAGRKGVASITQFIPKEISHVLLSVGSGTTFIGLRNALSPEINMLGFAPMKGGAYLQDVVRQYVLPQKNNNWSIIDRFHFGGFGKSSTELYAFMQAFKQQFGFDLDQVYTAKMMLGLKELLSENVFPMNAKILCIHTGGLTGN